MSRQLRVFLCHASQDKPAVRELYNALKAEGWIDPWLDKAKILPGQDWEIVIEKAVDDSDVVITCLSSQSITKEGFVQREIRYAYDMALEKPEETIFLIPLRLDNCNVPRKLRSLHWVDYFGSDKENSYSDLLEALKLRYEQVLRSEAEELERQRIEEQAQQETDELIRKFAAERIAWEQRKRKIPQLKERIAQPVLAVEEKKEQVKKPFTKFLDPSSLAPNVTSSPQAGRQDDVPSSEAVLKSVRKFQPNKNIRWLGMGGFAIIALLFIIFGGNYPAKNFPSVAETPLVTPSSTLKSPTPTATKILTSTPVPPTPTPTLGIGSTEVSSKDGMTLLYVPKGEFLMGSKDSDSFASSEERPQHSVILDAFWIDQTEVTNTMYAKCVAANKCEPPQQFKSYSRPNYFGNAEFDNYPVVYANWDMANAYCSWADRRLPTEAEWEKAARGTKASTYPWGEGIDCNKANYDSEKSCVGDTSPVKNYPNGISPYGAYDMAGNVWEWVSSLYQTYPYAAYDGRENLSSSGLRMLRGGSWLTSNYYNRSAFRFKYLSTDTGYSIGFRCARSP